MLIREEENEKRPKINIYMNVFNMFESIIVYVSVSYFNCPEKYVAHYHRKRCSFFCVCNAQNAS